MSFDANALLGLLHAHSFHDVLGVLLQAVGGLTLIWVLVSRYLPKLTVALLPYATRAAGAVALFLVTNPVTGPALKDPGTREKVKEILRGLLDMVTKLTQTFEKSLEDNLDRAEAQPAAPPAGGKPDGGPQAADAPSPAQASAAPPQAAPK